MKIVLASNNRGKLAELQAMLAPLGVELVRQADLGVGDKVMFLGEVVYSDLPAIYRAADIKVISSDFESFCFAALEAMATGLPIVTTDCGWVPKLLGQESGGLVVLAKDPEAFAKAMQTLADQPAFARTWARKTGAGRLRNTDGMRARRSFWACMKHC